MEGNVRTSLFSFFIKIEEIGSGSKKIFLVAGGGGGGGGGIFQTNATRNLRCMIFPFWF